MKNKAELIENDIIYVQKVGDQTEQSLFELIGKINQVSTKLRAQNKRVLILSNSEKEGTMDVKALKLAAQIGKDMDYDKSATYGSTPFLRKVREDMISVIHLDQKVANFVTKEEALAWLLK